MYVKLKFKNKIFIFGYGLVGKSFLRLLKEEIELDMKQVFIIDKSKEELNEFLNEGGLKENYLLHFIESNNYKRIFSSIISKGDALLDFSEQTKNLDSLTWCLQNGVFYLSTSDGTWPEEDETATAYDIFKNIKKIETKYQKGYPSSVIEIGCNPGIVSLFVKEGIKKVAEDIENKSVIKALNNNDFATAAKELEIETIIISDHDTLELKESLNSEDIFYNTWSPVGLYDEAVSLVELVIGTSFDIDKIKDKVKYFNPKDGYCLLNVRGIETIEKTYSPSGYFDGHLITHEETLTIGDYLSVYEDNKLIYNPTVYFSYRPSKIALASLNRVKDKGYIKPNSFVRLSDVLSKGGEYVGIILISRKYGNYYFGTGIDINDLRKKWPRETPTIIQVTSPAVAAFKWMIKNPDQGLTFPERLPEVEILNATKKYLGEFNFHKIEGEIATLKALEKN